MTDPYVQPSSVAEAMARRADIVAEILSIQSQLSDRNKVHGSQRPPDPEYQDWRNRAIFALTARQAELGRIKAYLTAESERRYTPPQPGDSAMRQDTFFEAIRLACDSHRALRREVDRLHAEVDRLRTLAGEPATVPPRKAQT